MRVINFGSINIDHVYRVEHFVRPGETLRSDDYKVFSGGKGANQSIALAHAGVQVLHAGKIGRDGAWLKHKLEEAGVDTVLIEMTEAPTGHAIIQVNKEGENAIIIHGGANESVVDDDIQRVLDACEAGDFLLLQNEINSVDRVLLEAKKRGLFIVFNPAPMTEAIKSYPLEAVDIFIINQVEGEMLTGKKEPLEIIQEMQKHYPRSKTVLTLGKEGVIYADAKHQLSKKALDVVAVDTTGAGDTFIGYFLAGVVSQSPVEKALEMAISASALCVTRAGAADSIPGREEVKSKFNLL